MTAEKIAELIPLTNRCRLLYVEDNQEARESTHRLLERFFKDITVAVNGSDGLEKFKNGTFDLVMTDINMPGMDGLEMLSYIKKIDAETATIVLSAHNEKSFLDEAEKLGVDSYLTKPLDLTALVDTLLEVIKVRETT